MPYIVEVAIGKREMLRGHGNDYPTLYGTSIQDYIHVDDLARGHLAALKAFDRETGILTVNLGL